MEHLHNGHSGAFPVDEHSAHSGHHNHQYDPTSTIWKICTNGAEEFWRSNNLSMVSRTPQPSPGSSLTVESIQNDADRFVSLRIKSEPLEQGLSSVVVRGPVRQHPGRDNLERIAPQEPVNLQLIVEDLPRLPYETGRQHNLSSAPRVIYFQTQRPRGGAFIGVNRPDNDIGFSLRKAFANELDDLIDKHEPARLEEVSAKISIRLLFHGCEPYNRQIMARRSTAISEPISMGTLAHKIAKEMQKCLANTYNAGKPLYHRGRVLQLDDLYLWRLVKVSPGSWIPEFKVNMMI